MKGWEPLVYLLVSLSKINFSVGEPHDHTVLISNSTGIFEKLQFPISSLNNKRHLEIELNSVLGVKQKNWKSLLSLFLH